MHKEKGNNIFFNVIFVQNGRDTVWPHDPRTGWSYCVTIPSWVVLPKSRNSDPVVVIQNTFISPVFYLFQGHIFVSCPS